MVIYFNNFVHQDRTRILKIYSWQKLCFRVSNISLVGKSGYSLSAAFKTNNLH